MPPRKIHTLADAATLAERLALLSSPHMAPLEAWRARVSTPERTMPHMDPLDGGAGARLLLLLETPGPGKLPLRFVSRDNATGTARNLRRFLAEAEIPREDTLLWNAVPWIIHAPGARNRNPKPVEIRHGLTFLPELLERLPNLDIAVLAGKAASAAEAVIHASKPGIPVLLMPHPSPTYVCTRPDIPERILSTLRLARRVINARAREKPPQTWAQRPAAAE